MEQSNKLAKIVGFITIIFILAILVFVALKIVDKNQEKKKDESETVTYNKQNIDLKLNGDYIEYVKKGRTYIDKGVKATSKDGTSLSNNVFISYFNDNRQVASIDTNNLNSYLIKYTVLDPNTNKTEEVYRTVIITK